MQTAPVSTQNLLEQLQTESFQLPLGPGSDLAAAVA